MINRIAIIVALCVMPLWLSYEYVSELVAVDRVLDSGASYNYSNGEADLAKGHPYIPFHLRHKVLIGMSFLSLAAMLLIVLKSTAWSGNRFCRST